MVAQIITIVNQSGKVVKSSKTLVNVFNEAKTAYNEKKAELRALRQTEREKKGGDGERRARKQLGVMTLDDDDDAASRQSARSSHDAKSIRRKPVPSGASRPAVERGVSDSFYTNDDRDDAKPRRQQTYKPSGLRFNYDGELDHNEPYAGELVRRHTSGLESVATSREQQRPHTPTRSASLSDIDMDLAYGELPPPLPSRRGEDTVELRDKMTGLQRLLEECNCVQHSVTAIVEHLSKNPDAMAAVALTLAEISNLAAKLAPGALMALKGSFPAIVALLASPEFAIAVGVGVGVTVIALGGYKIVKKIQARREEKRLIEGGGVPGSPSESVDYELREIDKIEIWRRGIAEAEVGSSGASVEGEFVTPVATRALIEEGKLKETDLKAKNGGRKGKKRGGKAEGRKASKSKSKVSVGTSRSGREKAPSGLRTLFSGRAKA